MMRRFHWFLFHRYDGPAGFANPSSRVGRVLRQKFFCHAEIGHFWRISGNRVIGHSHTTAIILKEGFS
jgi:hypothetical protein